MPPSPSIAVFLNASAGTAATQPQLATQVGDLFRAAGCDPRILVVEGQHLKNAARDASARASVVVAGGGDGTVSCVAGAVLGSPAALGVLPLGTLNHFAKDLHIPLTLPEAVAVIVGGVRTRVDVGQVNDRIFVNNSSIGVYPDIVQERDVLRGQGHRKWPAMAIAAFRVLRRYRGVTVRVDVDGRPKLWQTPVILIGNNEYTMQGLAVGTRARLDQGQLFLHLAPRAHARDLPMLFAKALVGRARQSGAFEIVAATEVTIETRSRRPVRVAVDGEVVKMTTPLRYRTHPGALEVMVPRP